MYGIHEIQHDAVCKCMCGRIDEWVVCILDASGTGCVDSYSDSNMLCWCKVCVEFHRSSSDSIFSIANITLSKLVEAIYQYAE
jgi:hypothetical protein